jgi:very-short-patch-repair endonuclease
MTTHQAMPTREKEGTQSPLSRVRERAGVRVSRARALRSTSTDAEKCLWTHLRNRQLLGYKFRRQHPIGHYFADFACIECGLVVELDGGQHADQANYDHARTIALQGAGFHVLRFWNHDVLQQTPVVLTQILQYLQTDPHPNPLPHAGEGVKI